MITEEGASWFFLTLRSVTLGIAPSKPHGVRGDLCQEVRGTYCTSLASVGGGVKAEVLVFNFML